MPFGQLFTGALNSTYSNISPQAMQYAPFRLPEEVHCSKSIFAAFVPLRWDKNYIHRPFASLIQDAKAAKVL